MSNNAVGDWTHRFKVVLMGDDYVGKTSLLTRFTENTFSTGPLATIGIDFKCCNVQVDGRTVRLQLWDTAGQWRFRSIINAYLRETAGIVLVYDTTKLETFRYLELWLRQIRDHAGSNIVVMVVGNKSDLKHLRDVPTDMAQAFCEREGLMFIEASAADGTNVETAFRQLTEEMYSVVDTEAHAGTGSP